MASLPKAHLLTEASLGDIFIEGKRGHYQSGTTTYNLAIDIRHSFAVPSASFESENRPAQTDRRKRSLTIRSSQHSAFSNQRGPGIIRRGRVNIHKPRGVSTSVDPGNRSLTVSVLLFSIESGTRRRVWALRRNGVGETAWKTIKQELWSVNAWLAMPWPGRGFCACIS